MSKPKKVTLGKSDVGTIDAALLGGATKSVKNEKMNPATWQKLKRLARCIDRAIAANDGAKVGKLIASLNGTPHSVQLLKHPKGSPFADQLYACCYFNSIQGNGIACPVEGIYPDFDATIDAKDEEFLGA